MTSPPKILSNQLNIPVSCKYLPTPQALLFASLERNANFFPPSVSPLHVAMAFGDTGIPYNYLENEIYYIIKTNIPEMS